jgi:hypothetical protein
MNEQVVNKGVSFFPAFLYCTHMKKEGDRGRHRMKAQARYGRPARSVEEGLWTETGSEEKKVRARRGVRTHRQRGDAPQLALVASNRRWRPPACAQGATEEGSVPAQLSRTGEAQCRAAARNHLRQQRKGWARQWAAARRVEPGGATQDGSRPRQRLEVARRRDAGLRCSGSEASARRHYG